MKIRDLILVCLIILTIYHSQILASNPVLETKQGFVSLSEAVPTMIINLKYSGKDNIFLQPLPGMQNKALLSSEAAEALAAVQQILISKGYSLVLYDAYRPYKTHQYMLDWLNTPSNQQVKNFYYPNQNKSDLRSLIEEKAAHYAGSTVDVTIIKLDKKLNNKISQKKKSYRKYPDIIYLDDGTVDMGSSYDMLDAASCYDCIFLHKDAVYYRTLLKNLMEDQGFKASEKFWWQFTLIRQPFADSKFDFDL